jgi:hypothetical protein
MMKQDDIEQALEYIATALQLFPRWAGRGNFTRDQTIDSVGNYGSMVLDLLHPQEKAPEPVVIREPTAPIVSGTLVHFSTRDLKSRNVKLTKGCPFPSQDRDAIRGLGAAFGVTDSLTKRLVELPYVTSVVIPDHEYAAKVIRDKIPLTTVLKALKNGDSVSHAALTVVPSVV